MTDSVSTAVLGLIPARKGSTRVPGKNTRALAGKPLVSYAIEAGLGASEIDRLVVTSDDDEVLDIANRYGNGLALRRPAEISTNTSLAIEYVEHALQSPLVGNGNFGIIVIIQATSPFVQPQDIDATISLLKTSGADSAVTVQMVNQVVHPWKLKRMEGDRLLPFMVDEQNRMAAHEIPALFVRNGAVYASRRSVIEQRKIIGDDCRGYVMPMDRSVDINEEIDFRFAEFLLSEKS